MKVLGDLSGEFGKQIVSILAVCLELEHLPGLFELGHLKLQGRVLDQFESFKGTHRVGEVERNDVLRSLLRPFHHVLLKLKEGCHIGQLVTEQMATTVLVGGHYIAHGID